jgi:DNA-binding response OmpR family regulator
MAEPAKKKILLVDEDDRLKRSCSDVLTSAGYKVELASNGEEAYGKLREASFDLVITGMRLPGLDGIGLYLDTLKIYANMREKFLFMEKETCAEEQMALQQPDARYLVKPFNAAELLKKVETLTGVNLSAFLMKHRSPGENRRADKRLCWTEDLKVWEGSRVFRPFVHTMDISRRGVRIRYMGSMMQPGSAVTVEIRYMDVKCGALVVWSMALSENEAASGLALSSPVPASSLLMASKGRKAFIPPLVSGS